ncbi:acyltransferase [Mucilaginibacter endophyticus]|uniref:acyltransferase n=1 Tax=Mucilaginibacter endophyticus TaxID=2675003 RepID=UPI000E0D475A|nr:acyltransferase [Mucilaginibacter endophyticus]
MYRYLKNILRKLFSVKSYRLFPQSDTINIAPTLIMGKNVNINAAYPDVNINIGDNVIFKEFCSVLVFSKAKLTIGNNIFFNNYCSINCLDQITIGDNTIIGESVKMYDHNHAYEKSPIVKTHPSEYTLGAITIGKDCWIGSNVTILKGVTIGDNVIIGANCLIYKSIPSNSIVKALASVEINTF